jgi:hypothetical protein
MLDSSPENVAAPESRKISCAAKCDDEKEKYRISLTIRHEKRKQK